MASLSQQQSKVLSDNSDTLKDNRTNKMETTFKVQFANQKKQCFRQISLKENENKRVHGTINRDAGEPFSHKHH